ncbi:cytochrome c, partial [Xanthomonas oryzae pv. oryzae]
MPNALHAPRLAIALVAALMMAACSQSQVEST